MGMFTPDDIDGLFDDSAYGLENYTEVAPSDDLLTEVEAELGYRLPAAFVELARSVRNGGTLERDAFAIDGAGVWADDHVAVGGFRAIGRTAMYSLLGQLGSTFMRDEWGYPDIGVYFADTPTAGHSEFVFDYRACGPQGEPSVAVVDQEDDYAVVQVAPDFATFVRGLVPMSDFDPDPAEVLAEQLAIVNHGTLSPVVLRGIAALGNVLPDAEASLRAVGRRIVTQKGHFNLHADGDSALMYSAMFLLYSALTTAHSREAFVRRPEDVTDYTIPSYELMIPTSFVAEPYGFSTGGWAPAFVTDWWDASVENGSIVEGAEGFRFSPDAEAGVLRLLRLAPTIW